MAVLEVLKFPDKRLREISSKVTQFDSKNQMKLAQLAEDMFETMYAENGIGLAAPQVGELIRMIIVDARPRETGGRYEIKEMTELEKSNQQPLIMINPVITEHEGRTTFDEGCLSVPSFFETVERYRYIEIRYQDLEGSEQSLKTDGLLAIVIQHEMDHLEGTLFIDHLSLVKSNQIKNQIKKHGYPPKKVASQNAVDGQEEQEL